MTTKVVKSAAHVRLGADDAADAFGKTSASDPKKGLVTVPSTTPSR
jgi:hypothetical protein